MPVTQLRSGTAMARQREVEQTVDRPESVYYTEFEDDDSDIEQTSLQSSSQSVSISRTRTDFELKI